MSNPNMALPFIPPLVDGERLTRDEFESRYDATPDLKRAELIEGIVHIAPPVRLMGHGIPCTVLISWLASYYAATPGTRAGVRAHIRFDSRNMLQPDVSFIILPSYGGRARISADDYLEVGPELVACVWPRGVNFNFDAKFGVYQRNGVREFVVWRTEQQQIDWFVLRDGKYERLAPTPAGLLCSETFPGLWLDTAALLADDFPAVLATLQRGISDPAHAAFVAELQRRAGTAP